MVTRFETRGDPDEAGSNSAAIDQSAVPNLTFVKNQIREYYGDYLGGDGRHRCSFSSRWALEVTAVTARAKQHLAQRLAAGAQKPALVLDVDDTALTTYPYLANNEFGSRQNRELLPAIPPTLELACYAQQNGVSIFFITERTVERRDDTLANLLAVGFPPPTELFLRVTTPPFPEYLGSPCCTTQQFKSSTRAYIQSQGYLIAVCVGDQDSDLGGGNAAAVFKLPNPMYHIP